MIYVWLPTRKTPKSPTKEANCQLWHFQKLANGRGVVFGKDRAKTFLNSQHFIFRLFVRLVGVLESNLCSWYHKLHDIGQIL